MTTPAYTVEIDPSAWSQLALLRVEIYRQVREALKSVASEVVPGESDRPALFPLVIGDMVAHYDVDHQRRRVLLREVGPSTQES